MTRWVEYLRAHSQDLLRPAEGYGDWLSVGEETPKDVLATAYFAYSTDLTARAAKALGKTDDAKKYGQLASDIKAAFVKAYVGQDGRIKGDTQTCYTLALRFDLLPTDMRPLAAKHLLARIAARNGHISTGFVGVSYLLSVLTEAGQLDTAYKLLNNDTFPSWGYSIKHGATSIWERWDGWTQEKGFQDPGMNSFAHYSLGAVTEWIFRTIGGIENNGLGFDNILICPRPGGGLTWAKAAYRSMHGLIVSDWRLQKGLLTLNVTIPAGTTAIVRIPTSDAGSVTEGVFRKRPVAQSQGVKPCPGSEPGVCVLSIGAGQYQFVAKQ